MRSTLKSPVINNTMKTLVAIFAAIVVCMLLTQAAQASSDQADKEPRLTNPVVKPVLE